MVTASYGHYGQRAARIGPDRICRIRLSASVSAPFFRRRHGSYCAKPTWIRSGWPGLVIIWPKRIWSGSKRVCRNQQARFLPDRYRPATSSHFQTRFCSSTDVTDNIVQNQPGSDLVLADRVRFCLNRSGPEAGRCAKSIWPAFGRCFPVDPDRRHIASGMFTEVVDWMMAAVFRRSSARCPTAVLAAKVSNRMTASCSCSKNLKQNDC